ncbi:acyl carrier protein [Streptomyces sp. NPDC087440]|uniref:acyl carrier protein n=1 Tax=Streptomyces sp. NPDC087440 TaxID=3365790 RepID=UPI00381B48B8
MTTPAKQPLTEETLHDVMHTQFKVPRESMTDETTFDELGMDSLALMEVLVALEERTGEELSDKLTELSPASTLAQAREVITGEKITVADNT